MESDTSLPMAVKREARAFSGEAFQTGTIPNSRRPLLWPLARKREGSSEVGVSFKEEDAGASTMAWVFGERSLVCAEGTVIFLAGLKYAHPEHRWRQKSDRAGKIIFMQK